MDAVEEVVKEGGEKRVVRLESQDYEKLERESFPRQKIAAPPEDFNVKALFTDVVKLMGSEAETALSTEFSLFLESCRNKDKQCLKTFVTGLSSNDKETRKSLHNVFKKHAGAFVESGTTKVDGEGGDHDHVDCQAHGRTEREQGSHVAIQVSRQPMA